MAEVKGDVDRKSTLERKASKLTINNNRRRGAPPFGHDVLRHARVVGRVGQTRLLDDQVVVDGDVEIPVLGRVDYLLVLQPLHLRWRYKGTRCEVSYS